MAPNYTVIGGNWMRGKGTPKGLTVVHIRIHMGDNKVKYGSDSAESQITNFRLEAEVAERESDVWGGGKDQY
jgi:hypothetical protein